MCGIIANHSLWVFRNIIAPSGWRVFYVFYQWIAFIFLNILAIGANQVLKHLVIHDPTNPIPLCYSIDSLNTCYD